MSSVIKLSAKSKTLNVKLKNPLEKNSFEVETDEEVFKHQLEQHYERGFNEGQKSVKEMMEKEYAERIAQKYESIDKIIDKLNMKIAAYEPAFEKLVINLALAISRKIVKREIKRESIINETLKESIRRVIGSNKIFVKLNPKDLKLINLESHIQFNDDTYKNIKFEPDDHVEEGGCLVETEIGNVDARISSQFSEVSKQLEANF